MQKKKWMAIAAGGLDIIGSILGGFFVSALLWLASCRGDSPSEPPSLFAEAIALVILAVAYLALVGGFCAIQRRKWKLALAGSIVAFLFVGVFGIAAVVLTTLAKDEFK
jgi:ABC-type transport system involved in multi-copper enzyme maturation permease subunit